MTEQDVYTRARKRVEDIRGLIIHAGMYVVVISGLFFVNLATRGDGGYWWFVWPAIGWGIGLGCHVVAIVAGAGSKLDAWEDRKVREIVEREQTRV